MKKQALKVFSMLSLAVTLAAVAVYANPTGSLTANIPFAFSPGDKTLPAGDYAVVPLTTPGVLRIRREDGRAAVLVLTQSVQARPGQNQTKLVFRRYGDQYFLAQIWAVGNGTGRELGQSRTERELIRDRSKHLAKNAVEPEAVSIAAQ